MSTFSLGISGLSAAKKNLNTVGNNIANASTVGFKRSRAEFADVYAKSGLGSATGQTGNGVRVSNIAQQFAQGGTTFTQNSLDLAIDGNGFFIVEEGNGTTSYTRAGMFGVDKEGFVVSSTGQKLQGYAANANGDDIAVGAIDDIFIPQANISPNATSQLDVAFNLDSRSEPPTNYFFDASDSDTYTHLYPSVIYDTLGNSHTMTQYFIKQPPYLPEYGEPTRAIQTLLGAARNGIEGVMGEGNYGSTDGVDVFPGDVGGVAGAPSGGANDGDTGAGVDDVIDSDIDAIFGSIGGGFNLSTSFDGSTPEAAAAANAYNALTAGTTQADIVTAVEAAITAAGGAIVPGAVATAIQAAVDETDSGVTTPAGDADAAFSAAEASLIASGMVDPGLTAAINEAESQIEAAGGAAASTTVEAVYSDRLASIKTAIQGMVDASSGRAQEFYEDIYKAVDDYLPVVPSEITKSVFDGALEEIEGTIEGTQRGYAGIDAIAGELRLDVMNSALVDPLTGDINLTNILDTPAVTNTDLQNAYETVVSELEDARDNNQGTEEAGVYQLALNVLFDVEKDWSDISSARESMVAVMNALESEAADNRWHMHVTVDGEKVTDANENTPDYFSFNFTEFGVLDEPVPTMTIKDWVPKDNLNNQNGSDEPQLFEIDLEGTTQFAGSFGANSLSQDGFATGELAGLDINDEGIMIARYTNSQTRLIGQVALANFRNEQGLTPVGGTAWAASTKSGDPVVNSPGVGIAGNIMSKALEDSNVDLSEELVNMIIAQRDYQANAKTLQTADTITQTIINLR